MERKRTAIRGLVLVTTALAFPLWALAAGDSLSTMPVRLLSYAEADLMSYHFGYKEDVPPPYKSTENGLLTGLGVTLVRLEKGPSLFARLVGEYTGTSTHYDGTTQSGYPMTGETKNKFLNAEGNVGFTFPAPSATSLTVYSGLGYRYWERGLGGWKPTGSGMPGNTCRRACAGIPAPRAGGDAGWISRPVSCTGG